jgi:hypothetical protein
VIVTKLLVRIIAVEAAGLRCEAGSIAGKLRYPGSRLRNVEGQGTSTTPSSVAEKLCSSAMTLWRRLVAVPAPMFSLLSGQRSAVQTERRSRWLSTRRTASPETISALRDLLGDRLSTSRSVLEVGNASSSLG